MDAKEITIMPIAKMIPRNGIITRLDIKNNPGN